MPNAAALPKLSKLGFGSTTTVDNFLSFVRFNPGVTVEKLDTQKDVSTGALGHYAQRIVTNRTLVQPRAGLKPTVGEWGDLLPWMTYVTSPTESPTGTFNYAPGAATREVERYVDFYDTQKYWQLGGVAVNKWAMRAQSGAELLLDLEMVGKTFTNTGTFPSGLAPDLKVPFIMSNLAVAIGATTGVKTQDFSLTCDAAIDPNRFFNSATHAGPVNTDRIYELRLMLPWGLHHALWDAGAGDAGVAVTATFTGGGATLLLTMPAVVAQQNPFDVNVPTEVMLPWVGQPAALDDEGDFVPELTISYTPPA
jgi:hypothetical protein